MFCLVVGQGFGQRLCGCVDHLGRHVDGLAEDSAQPDPREDVHVVALAWGQVTAVEVEIGKWAAGGEERAALGVLHGVLEGAFGVCAWVGEREDDGLVVELAHAFEYGGREGAADGGEAHEDGGLDLLDDRGEGFDLVAGIVGTRKIDLVVC